MTRLFCISLDAAITMPSWRYQLPDNRGNTHIDIAPRLTVNGSHCAVEAAVQGVGVTQQLHYQVKNAIDQGDLQVILKAFEPDPIPVHLLHKTRQYLPQKMQSFLVFISPRLKTRLSTLSNAP